MSAYSENLRIFYNESAGNVLPVLMIDGSPWFALRFAMQALDDTRPVTVIKQEIGADNYRVFPKDRFSVMKNPPPRGYACVTRHGLSKYLKKCHAENSDFCRWVKDIVLPELGVPEKKSVEPPQVAMPVPPATAPTTYHHEQFGDLKVIMLDGEPWFIGKEVAEKLGYSNTQKSIRDHVDNEDKLAERIVLSGQHRETILINESGLYSLILKSKLPLAKQFKRWVTSEVLPSIRKHGAYMTTDTLQKVMNDPDTWIMLLTELKNQQKQNRDLAAANAALVKEECSWNQSAMLNALIRSYAVNRLGSNFAYAWNLFYKRLDYKHGINLKIRAGMDGRKKPFLEYLSDDEVSIAVSAAAAMCEESGLAVGKIINTTNAAALQTAVA